MAGAMGGAEGRRGAASGFSGVNGALVSRMKRSRSPAENVEGEREGKVALGLRLGLSTNGRFGVDPAMKQTKRSSPVSNMVFNVVSAGNAGDHRASAPHAPLMRSCSAPPGARLWLCPERPVSAGRLGLEKLKEVVADGLHGKEKGRSLKGAIESRGLQSDLVKAGATQTATTGSSSRHPLPNKASVKEEPTGTVANAGATSNTPVQNVPFKPYVSTRALGPNHKKIGGVLYKFDKLEDVKIVCNCHGKFHSPAEFVKHGGGSDEDIAYPLQRILVSPFPFC